MLRSPVRLTHQRRGRSSGTGLAPGVLSRPATQYIARTKIQQVRVEILMVCCCITGGELVGDIPAS